MNVIIATCFLAPESEKRNWGATYVIDNFARKAGPEGRTRSGPGRLSRPADRAPRVHASPNSAACAKSPYE
jgi:hypothetical protein